MQYDERNQSWEGIDKDQPQQAVYIHWLCVSREFAGKQLPKVLIDFSTTKAQEKNISLLRVDTNASEMKLRKLYENLGFDLAGIEQGEFRQTAFYLMLITSHG